MQSQAARGRIQQPDRSLPATHRGHPGPAFELLLRFWFGQDGVEFDARAQDLDVRDLPQTLHRFFEAMQGTFAFGEARFQFRDLALQVAEWSAC